MVFQTLSLLRRITHIEPVATPDQFWKKRRILKLSSHFYGRRYNIYKFAKNAVHRALRAATRSRPLKQKDFKEVIELFQTRLTAACEEHGFTYPLFKESLIRSNIQLNHKILADLAIWEPRTFKCLTDFAWKKAAEERIKGVDELADPPEGVLLKPTPIK